ncbi:uncharacterized protein LOC103507014 [Diaphorina citri]|uniref:protein-L-isoaspartate(D-aspartate) O-methyltransferase n=1 Tax=Diaphorina citri TaxID=121845 RepID=A0A1S4E8U8_DIACI|nr:uncharacterized protein LOC103507014 [Diaphorina citri]
MCSQIMFSCFANNEDNSPELCESSRRQDSVRVDTDVGTHQVSGILGTNIGYTCSKPAHSKRTTTPTSLGTFVFEDQKNNNTVDNTRTEAITESLPILTETESNTIVTESIPITTGMESNTIVDKTTSQVTITESIPKTSEIVTSPTVGSTITEVVVTESLPVPNKTPIVQIETTESCKKMSFVRSNVYQIFTTKTDSFMLNNTIGRRFYSSVHTTKKPLDRRRLVVMGGRVEAHRYQTNKMTSLRYAPHKIKTTNQQLIKRFTLKHSPIILQSIHKEVIDLRKLQSTPKTTSTTRKLKPMTNTEKPTTNKYEAKVERLKKEYLELISEERHFNESVIRERKKEQLEIQLREASMQKSYLYQFIVTKVTTESWEKDLPVSSKGRDELYFQPYEERLNNEKTVRRNLFVRKGKVLKKIEIAEQKLEEYRNATKKDNIKESDSFNEYYDDNYSANDDISNVRDKKRHLEKRKNFGKPDHHADESQDADGVRHHGKHHPKNLKKSGQHLVFHANDYCKMMQEGWSQRKLRKYYRDNRDLDKRKDDAVDIYEPDPDTSDEIERMKSYDITSNQQFIQYLKENNFAQDERVLEAIQWVDRDRFAKDGYIDSPHNFGTNSIVERPSYQAACLQHLSDKLLPGANVLDLGFGSGFMSCCMARMVGDKGHVTAVDHIPQLINLFMTKLKISYPKLYKLYKIMDVVEWDARKPYKKNGPYDVIHFGSGVKHIPIEFISDLKINGSILVPVGPPYGPHILKKITLIKRNLYTIQNLAEVEAFHFCSPEEQTSDFRQTFFDVCQNG